MDALLNKYNAVLTIPNGTRLYNKNEIYQTLKLDEKIQKNCLLALFDEISNSFTFISCLGKIEEQSDIDETIEAYCKLNPTKGYKLTNHNRLESTDGRVLNVLKFIGKNDSVINMFSCVNNYMFVSATSFQELYSKQSLSFANQVMQSLRPLK